MPGPTSPASAFTVLLVGTGNTCRSALAERLGRAYLDDALGDDASTVRLVSAGIRAVAGSAMDPDSALVLAGFGGDPAGFTAQELVDGLVMGADLVLAMTQECRRHVLTLAPRALARTFTLLEAAELLRVLGDEVEVPGGTPLERGRALVEEMATARARREDGADADLPDPSGKPLEVHQEVGEATVEALLRVLRGLLTVYAEGPRG